MAARTLSPPEAASATATPKPPTSTAAKTRPPRPDLAQRPARPARATRRTQTARARALASLQERLGELRWLQTGHGDDAIDGRIALLTEIRAFIRVGMQPSRALGAAWTALSHGPAGDGWARGVTLEARRWRDAREAESILRAAGAAPGDADPAVGSPARAEHPAQPL